MLQSLHGPAGQNMITWRKRCRGAGPGMLVLKIFTLFVFPSYSAAHEQLDSPRVSRTSRTRVLEHAHTCTRASTHEYSHTHTRVLARVHASTRKRTRSRSNACTRFTRSGHASLVPKPSTFFRGGRGLGIDAIDMRSRVLRALVTRAHTCVTRIALAYARIFTRE